MNSTRSTSSLPLPPGPRGLPVVGSLPAMLVTHTLPSPGLPGSTATFAWCVLAAFLWC